MRYIQSPHNYRQNRPRQSWWSKVFHSKKQSSGTTNRFANPYLKNKKKTRPIPFKTIGFICLVVGWIGLMIYIPYFRITTITSHGQKIIKTEEIVTLVREHLTPRKYWPKNNYFLVNQEKIASLINQNFSFQRVEVTKQFPNMISITVEEKISAIIYDDGQNYFLLDQGGTIIKQIFQAGEPVSLTTSTIATTTMEEHQPNIAFLKKDYGDFPVVYDKRQSTIDAANKEVVILPANFITGVIEFYGTFRRSKLGTMRYGIIEEDNKLIVVTDKPWRIFMQPTHNIQTQMDNLIIVHKQSKPMEYIDLRFGERVYWK